MEEEAFFGDPLNPNRHPHELLIGFSNVQALPAKRSGKKNFDLTGFLDDFRFDHFGVADTGRCWGKLNEEDRIPNRFRGHFPSRSTKYTVANNRTDPTSTAYQHGGTLSMTMDKMVGYAIEAGRDPSGLGRWTWQRFRGKGGAKIRIVTCYRPVPGTADGKGDAGRNGRKHWNQRSVWTSGEDSRRPTNSGGGSTARRNHLQSRCQPRIGCISEKGPAGGESTQRPGAEDPASVPPNIPRPMLPPQPLLKMVSGPQRGSSATT